MKSILFALLSSWILSGCVPPENTAEAATQPNSNSNTLVGYWAAMITGPLTPTSRFAGGWKSRGENIDGFTCSWEIPGTSLPSSRGSVSLQVWSYATDSEICACEFAACAVQSGIPSDCTCNNQTTSLGAYLGLRVKGGDCETWPAHMLCNVALNH